MFVYRNKKLCVLILLISSYVFGENFTNHENETLKSDRAEVPTEMTHIKRHCNQTDTCETLSTRLEDHDDLRTKTCLCDRQCSTYDDCCIKLKNYNESRQQDENFACIRTIHKCARSYSSVETVRRCETINKTEMLHDPLLFLPVTNEMKNVTYKNAFCAFCNSEWKFKFWNAMVRCKLANGQNTEIIPENFSIEDIHSTITSQLLLGLPNLKVDESGGNFVWKFGVSTYICEINAKLPDNLFHSVRYCRPTATTANVTHSHLSTKQISSTNLNFPSRTFQVRLNDSFLSDYNRCEDIPSHSEIGKAICLSGEMSLNTRAEEDVEFCFFKTIDGQRCLINRFLTKDDDFHYVDNDTIFVKSFKATFGAEEWIADADNGSTIFLCGIEIPRSQERKFYIKMNATISRVLIKFSIVSLIAHLILSANGNKLQSLPNKIMYSYSVTLFVIYVLWEMQNWLPSCQLASIIMHYLCLSCFVWLLIASYDCWLVVCHSSEKFLTFAGKTRTKRFLCYCFWSWISPLSVTAVAVYFEFAPNAVIPCSLKPGYGRLDQCFLAQETPLNYFYQYPSAIVACINISLFLHTSYRILISKRKGITSTAQNNSYTIFIKLSLNMGIVIMLVLVWTTYILVTNTDYVVFHTLQHIVEASQGVFMFFAFSFDKSMVKRSGPAKTEFSNVSPTSK